MKPTTLLMWLIPMAIIAGTACGPFIGENCDDLPTVTISSGTFVSEDDRDKSMVVDREAGEVTVTFTDVDGREVTEKWSMGEITVR